MYNYFKTQTKSGFSVSLSFSLPSISVSLASLFSTSTAMEDMRRNQLSELGCIVEATGRTGASFSNPCCGLEIHPTRETNLGCGMKQSSTGKCSPSFSLPSPFPLSTRSNAMHLVTYFCMYALLHINEKTWRESRNYAEIQHVRCRCNFYDLTNSMTKRNLENKSRFKRIGIRRYEDKLRKSKAINRLIILPNSKLG